MPDHNTLNCPIERLTERYRSAAPSTSVWSPAIDLMLQHRSIRAYRPDALPAGTIETLVAAAQSAATSSNLQTWSVVAVEDQARRVRLASFAGNQKHITQAPLFLIWLADLSRAARLGEQGGQIMETLPFLEPFLVAVIDASLAAQNATLAAESLGLGTVYIGAIRNNPEGVAAELQLPPGVLPVFGLCVGYQANDTQPAAIKPRLPQQVVLHHETYSAAGEDGPIAKYDSDLLAFQDQQGMPPQRWSELIRNRLGKIAMLSGRDRLRVAIHALGFDLK